MRPQTARLGAHCCLYTHAGYVQLDTLEPDTNGGRRVHPWL